MIKELILKEMPDNLSKLEKARYVYLKMATCFCLDTRTYSNNELFDININTIDTYQIPCSLWSTIYSDILSSFNINNAVISQGHDYVIFEYDNEFWIADALFDGYFDISRIKYGDETKGFGIALSQNPCKPTNEITSDGNILLEKIDKSFNFYQERKSQLNQLVERIKKRFDETLTLNDKLDIIFYEVGTLKSGYYETKEFIYMIEKLFLTEEEISMIHARELKRTNDDKDVDILECIYIDNSNIYYLLSPNQKIRRIKEDDLILLSTIGFGIGYKKIPNIDYPRNFKPEIIDKKLKYRLLKKQIPSSIIDYDIKQLRKII